MNDYCVDHGNWWQCFSTVFFVAYLTVDFVLCYFFICDQSPGAAQNYLHHVLGLIGTVSGLFAGRMLLTLGSISLMTEVSTPFVSLRALLDMHKMKDSKLYLVNGILMTLSFFVFRVIFQSWLVFYKLVPAVF